MDEQESTLGGSSQVLLTVSQVIYILNHFSSTLYHAFFYSLAMNVLGSVTFLAFAILLLAAVSKTFKGSNGIQIGTAGALLGIVTAIIGLVSNLAACEMFTGWSMLAYYRLNALFVIYWVFFGMTLVLSGLLFLICQEYLPSYWLSIATGAVYFAAGVFAVAIMVPAMLNLTMLLYASPMFYSTFPTTSALAAVASIMGAICFFHGKPLRKA